MMMNAQERHQHRAAICRIGRELSEATYRAQLEEELCAQLRQLPTIPEQEQIHPHAWAHLEVSTKHRIRQVALREALNAFTGDEDIAYWIEFHARNAAWSDCDRMAREEYQRIKRALAPAS
jgi:hypothetical protein